MSRYEQSVGPQRHVRSHMVTYGEVEIRRQTTEGAVCLRCTGLLIRRSVVTIAGTVFEDACVACGRAYNATVSTPYRKPRLVLSVEAEARLEALKPSSGRSRGRRGDDDDSMGIGLSSSVLDWLGSLEA